MWLHLPLMLLLLLRARKPPLQTAALPLPLTRQRLRRSPKLPQRKRSPARLARRKSRHPLLLHQPKGRPQRARRAAVESERVRTRARTAASPEKLTSMRVSNRRLVLTLVFISRLRVLCSPSPSSCATLRPRFDQERGD